MSQGYVTSGVHKVASGSLGSGQHGLGFSWVGMQTKF